MGHARALLGLKGQIQSKTAKKVAARGLSVRETEKLVRRLQTGESSGGTTKPVRQEDPNIRTLESSLTDKLGAMVRIQQGGSGKGKLVISYNNSDEFEGILDRLDLSD